MYRNLRKRRSVELCTDERSEKLVASSYYKNFKVFDEVLVAIQRQKRSILRNQPIYVEFLILELSKVLMYDLHYNFVEKMYPGNRAILLFRKRILWHTTLTVSTYKRKWNSAAQNLIFSSILENTPFNLKRIRKSWGKFKVELNGEAPSQFVGLKSKMYSMKSSKDENKRAKGTSMVVVRKKLKHNDYLKCLESQTSTFELQKRIG